MCALLSSVKKTRKANRVLNGVRKCYFNVLYYRFVGKDKSSFGKPLWVDLS